MKASTATPSPARSSAFENAIAPGTQIAIIEFGTNDLRSGASMPTVCARLAELIRSLRARGIEVRVIGLGSLDLSSTAKGNNVMAYPCGLKCAPSHAKCQRRQVKKNESRAHRRAIPSLFEGDGRGRQRTRRRKEYGRWSVG